MSMSAERAREISDNTAIDALMDGPIEPFTSEQWHDVCADYLLSDKQSGSDELRQQIKLALEWIAHKPCSPIDVRAQSSLIQLAATNIGNEIISNCIRNRLTLEMLEPQR